MNETEWLSGIDPTPMLKFGAARLRRRALQLLACACCRRLWNLLPPGCRSGLEIAERFADAKATLPELEQAHAKANAAIRALPNEWSYEVIRLRRAASAVVDCTSSLAATTKGAIAIARSAADAIALDSAVSVSKREFAQARTAAHAVELRVQADLVREIFGNPYRNVPFSSEWHTDTAIQLANMMYDARDFGAMPILADALQDAGCEHADILSHCREVNATHVRGCWVLDCVRDKVQEHQLQLQ